MSVEYVNRRGDKYTLQEGKTRSGKPRYYLGRKLTGTLVDALPEGYEIYESPGEAQVFLRKIRPSPISPKERELVADGIREHARLEHFLLDVQDNSLIVYLADRDPDEVAAVMGSMFGAATGPMDDMKEWIVTHTHYTKMLRFTLVDEDKRLYSTDRWCFLGGIDDWFPVGSPGKLPDLVRRYAKHLGKDSFFELM